MKRFPRGFRDETHLAWERDHKWDAHQRWQPVLDRPRLHALLADGSFREIALPDPKRHFFFKPTVTRLAAAAYGHELAYRPRPDREIYQGVLRFAQRVGNDLRDLRPHDMIDIQSFLWVQGSDEY